MNTVHFSPRVWVGLTGLGLALVAFAVLAFDLSMIAFHPKYDNCPCPQVSMPVYAGELKSGQFESQITAPPVNRGALNELKQGPPCVNCPPNRIIRPTVQPSYVQPARPANPQPVVTPQPSPQPVNPQPVPVESKKPIIALFLDGSAKSQMIKQWFDTDPGLVAVKSKCSFETYTPDNALYKTRYSSIVPVSQFPVVLFLYSDGGHIHAAGGNMIPRTPAELYSDMRSAYDKAQSVRTASIPDNSGLVKTRGYSWDQQITPTMQLAPEDCPGGVCPPDRGWRLGGNRDGGLFDSDGRSAVGWISPTEIFQFCLMGLAGLLLFAIFVVVLVKRGS